MNILDDKSIEIPVEKSCTIKVKFEMENDLEEVEKSFGEKIKGNIQELSKMAKDALSQTGEAYSAFQESIVGVSSSIKDIVSGVGDFAASTSDENKAKVEKISETFSNVFEDIPSKFEEPMGSLLDIVSNVVNSISECLSDGQFSEIIEGISEKLGDFISVIGEIVEGCMPLIINALTWLLDNNEAVTTGIIAVAAAFETFEILSSVYGLVSSLIELVSTLMLPGSLFFVIPALIAAVVASIVYLWNTNEDFRNAVIEIWNVIKDTFVGVWQSIVDFFTVSIPAAWDSICTFFMAIPDWFKNIWLVIKQAFIDGWNAVSDFFSKTIPEWIIIFVQWFNELPGKIGYALGCLLGKVIEFGVSCWGWIKNDLPGIISGIVDWFAKLPGNIWSWLFNAVSNVIRWGSDMYNNAVSAVSSLIDNVTSWFASLPGRIGNCLGGALSALVQWGSNMISNAGSAMSSMVSTIINTIANLPSTMISIGRNIVSGIWQGISNSISWIKNKISDFCGGIINGIKDTLGIHSPSRVMRDLIGKNLVRGIGLGIDIEYVKLASDVKKDMENLTALMEDTVKFQSLDMLGSVISLSGYKDSASSIVNNNDNGIVQNITITQPVKSPSETARAIRRAGRELAFG